MKRNRQRKLTIAALVAVLSAGGLSAQVTELIPLEPQSPAPAAGPVDETPTLWFVELSGNPLADGGNPGQLRAEKQAFRNVAAQATLRFTERYAFDNLWNGLSVSISPADIGKLSRLPGVKAIYPVEVISRPAPGTTSVPDLQTAINMTGANVAQSSLGLTGTGVRVAVMDTGIDIDHPDLGGNGAQGSTAFPTTRITHGYDFVGDAFNADPSSPNYNPVPVPDPNPDDCNGHGTHVAGIIGANGPNLKGVAPGVTFGAYRVFGCEGSTTGDIMLAAMERALADGMHVLNMSIGSAFQWPQYPTAQAADRLVNKGVVVVASTGNSGANGLYAAGAPGLGKKVIAVASVDNTHVQLSTFTASPGGATIGYAPATGAPLPPTSGSLVLARTGTPASAADACSSLPAGSLAGKAVLIRRGTCTFHVKALNAQNAGAAAVILYNNTAGRFSPNVAGTPAITIPVVAISDAEGIQLNNLIATNAPDTVTITWTASSGSFLNSTGGLISSFSSYGLSPDLELKPDIAAPGGLISSTYPLENGGYATISGTSMAAPQVAGGVALLLQAKPKTSVQNVRTILQNSADPKAWWGNPGLGLPDNVHRQGAGVVDIDDAILATTVVSPGKISLGESEAGPKTVTLTVSNNASTPVVYDLTSVNALSTGSSNNSVSFHLGAATASFAAPSLAVPANSSASVNVTITAPPTPVNGTYGGYLVLTPQGGGQVYRVPFAGHIGNYQALQVLTPTANAFPWLAKADGASYSKQNAGVSFTMAGNDIPFVLVHLEHQSRKLRVEVVDAVTGRNWHRAFEEDYLPRNSTATGFFAFPFDGVTVNGNRSVVVPNGNYVLKLSVLKALGDESNPAHWETWTSPAFVIARP